MCLSISRSVYICLLVFVCLFLCLSPIFLCFLSVCSSVSLFFVSLSVGVCWGGSVLNFLRKHGSRQIVISLSVWLCLSVCDCVRLPVSLSVCLSVCWGGSLLNFLRKHGSRQTVKTLVKICEDAAAGMTYLASMNCIHRWVKPICCHGNSDLPGQRELYTQVTHRLMPW